MKSFVIPSEARDLGFWPAAAKTRIPFGKLALVSLGMIKNEFTSSRTPLRYGC